MGKIGRVFSALAKPAKWYAGKVSPPHLFGKNYALSSSSEKFDFLHEQLRKIPLKERYGEKIPLRVLPLKAELLKLDSAGLQHAIEMVGGLDELKRLFRLSEEQLQKIEAKICR